MFVLIVQRLFLEAVADIFYFPLWWYSKGMARAARWCAHLLQRGNETLAPGLWLANIFVPMYGQYDFTGRLFSFLMRLVQVIARTIALLLWLAFCLALFMAWLAIPIAVVYGTMYSLSLEPPARTGVL